MTLLILAGAAYSYYLGDELRYIDEEDYHQLTVRLVQEGSYSPDGHRLTAYRPPGYPLVLAPFVFLGAGVHELRLLNFLALALSLYLLHLLMKRQEGQLASVIGILLFVGYPVLFYAAGTLYPQTVATCLFLLILHLLTLTSAPGWKFWLGGFLFGFLVLMVPTFIFALFVWAAWYWIMHKRQGMKKALIAVLSALVIISLWTIRNYSVYGTFVFISTNSGMNLFIGNSENAKPNSGLNLALSQYDDQIKKMNEVERDAFYRAKALHWMSENKMAALKLYCLKVLNYFNYRNELYTSSEASPVNNLIMLITWGPLLFLFVCRLLFIGKFKPSSFEMLLLALYLGSAFFHAIFFTRIRFRLPFDPLLIMVVAIFLQSLWSARGKKAQNC